MRVTLKKSETADPVDITIEHANGNNRAGYTATVGDRHCEFEHQALKEGSGWIKLAGKLFPYHATRDGDTIHAWIAGRTYKFEIVDKTARRSAAGDSAAAANVLKAPMPGTILEIKVAEGDSFEAHEAVILMESMKMEMTLSAPQKCRVKEICCQVGELVEMGRVLAKLEPQDDE